MAKLRWIFRSKTTPPVPPLPAWTPSPPARASCRPCRRRSCGGSSASAWRCSTPTRAARSRRSSFACPMAICLIRSRTLPVSRARRGTTSSMFRRTICPPAASGWLRCLHPVASATWSAWPKRPAPCTKATRANSTSWSPAPRKCGQANAKIPIFWASQKICTVPPARRTSARTSQRSSPIPRRPVARRSLTCTGSPPGRCLSSSRSRGTTSFSSKPGGNSASALMRPPHSFSIIRRSRRVPCASWERNTIGCRSARRSTWTPGRNC